MNKKLNEIMGMPRFQELSQIGGHKVYHLEGDALTHTKMVVTEATKVWGPDSPMVVVAALHDIGKLYTSVCNGPDDWTYPGHAKEGAEHLSEFMSPDNKFYEETKWFIANHIKPLFWMNSKNLAEDLEKIMKAAPEGSQICTIKNLALLGLCDIRGSKTELPENPAEGFLEEFVKEL